MYRHASAVLGPGCCIGGTAAVAHTLQPTTVRTDTPMVVRVASVREYTWLLSQVPRLHPVSELFARLDHGPTRSRDVLTPVERV